jgi:hypothetical protein
MQTPPPHDLQLAPSLQDQILTRDPQHDHPHTT